MAPLDRSIAKALTDDHPSRDSQGEHGPARILFVADNSTLRSHINRLLKKTKHSCTCVNRLDYASAELAQNSFDLILLIRGLPDGDGLGLIRVAQKTSPWTKGIVVAQSSDAHETIESMRSGAVDVVLMPDEKNDFIERLAAALEKSHADRHRHDRILRLKRICRALNTARHDIAKQVDGLCEELARAYHDVAEQLNEVAMASEFRTLLKQELDVEDLLRTMLQYLLTKTGPMNAAVFLPDEYRNFALGAYMNCDCPRESVAILLDHLCQAICPQMADECELVSYTDAAEFAKWIGADAGILANSHIVAFSCRHRGECLAVIVLFRDKAKPFDDHMASVVETLRPIIAEQLANIVKVHHRSQPSWPKEATDGDFDYDDDLGFGYEGGLAA